jgi:hypothetical protein
LKEPSQFVLDKNMSFPLDPGARAAEDRSARTRPADASLFPRFRDAVASDPAPSADSLARILNSLFALSRADRASFFANYEDYENLSTPDYKDKFLRRLDCFSQLEDPDFLRLLDSKIPDTLPIPSILSQITANLDPAESQPFTLLFLLSRVPSRLSPTDLALPDVPVQTRGPIVTWLIGRCHLAGFPFSQNDLFSLFVNDMLNPDTDYGPISVAAAHLMAFSMEKHKSLHATHFVRLIQLDHTRSTNRDRIVAQSVHPVRTRWVIDDVENYAKCIMLNFPDCPRWARIIFKDASLKFAKFFEGWVEFHKSDSEISKRYLDALRDVLPPGYIARFETDVRETVEPSKAGGRYAGMCVWIAVVVLLAAVIAGYLGYWS